MAVNRINMVIQGYNPQMSPIFTEKSVFIGVICG